MLERWAPFCMSFNLRILFLFCCVSCSEVRQHELVKTGEARFRITLNSPDRGLSEVELDSLENTRPFYAEPYKKNKFFDLLTSKGFVSYGVLDTSGLHLSLVTWEKPIVNFGEMQLTLDTTSGIDHVVAKANERTLKTDLGPRLLGDIFVSYFDIDSDGKPDLLVMTKYYVMGGYNFDLKIFDFS